MILRTSSSAPGCPLAAIAALLVEAGCRDQQKAAFLVRSRDVGKHLFGYVPGNKLVKRRCIGERVAEYDAIKPVQRAHCPNIFIRYRRVNFVQLANVRATQKDEWRDH